MALLCWQPAGNTRWRHTIFRPIGGKAPCPVEGVRREELGASCVEMKPAPRDWRGRWGGQFAGFQMITFFVGSSPGAGATLP